MTAASAQRARGGGSLQLRAGPRRAGAGARVGRQPLPHFPAHVFLMSSPGSCSRQDAERLAQAAEACGPGPALSPGPPTLVGMSGRPWGPEAPRPGRALHAAGPEDGFKPRQ